VAQTHDEAPNFSNLT